MTKCPRCVQRIHRSAVTCPHCGFDIADVDAVYGAENVRLEVLSDAAGLLRAKERKQMRLLIKEFERVFPQLFFSVYLGAFEEKSQLRQFGFWLLNRGAFVDVEVSRPNECGILLTVDAVGKTAGLTYGYALHPFLDEEVTFKALSAGHPFLLQGMYYKGIEAILKRLSLSLRRRSRRAKSRAEKYEGFGKPAEAGQLLERIRANHQHRDSTKK